MLEKRPPTGIWGGLWSLPEFDSIDAARDWCLTKNITIASEQALPSLRHTFSHYHLDYTPLVIQTNSPTNFVMEADQSLWYNFKLNLGLATPIKQLLQQHNTEHNYD